MVERLPSTGLPADSAGVPWEGRQFEQNTRADDDGSASAELMDALHAFRSGERGPEAVADAFRGARLLIPLVAQLGGASTGSGTDVGPTGHRVDKSQELSIVTVAGPDGRTVLPVFSSVETLARWNPAARPVPADGVRVALAAANENTDLVVLDPLSPSEFALRRPALWAIARGEAWLPSPVDPDVARAFEESASAEAAVTAVRLRPGDPEQRLRGPELVVELVLEPGLGREAIGALVARLQERWSRSDVIAARVDSLHLALAAA